MVKGIIGKKVGMTQLFDESGKVIPVTVDRGWSLHRRAEEDRRERMVTQAVRAGLGEVPPEGQQGSCRPLQEGKCCPQEDPARVPSGRCLRNERRRCAEG